ncbi:signal transduction histidine kinase [Ruminiclostridium sufflavum DSM 19573]|uniref:histidine kinase n=1 Tax=Ruminiclostridium sufflavum DSM 19573 TaxID=1121337 RepID=A0A318XRS4_9FIRM|nr:HAMP domain-containing sensor histidine kinase [Ruminiclostridium sufflavum]PYG89154.1 signal transduction histidine kinase [Ruminiclostridium sufflavum DSM 19573]
MSMRRRFIIIIASAIALNIILLFGYFSIFVSDSFFSDFSVLQSRVDNKTYEIAQDISNNLDYRSILDGYSEKEYFIFRLEDLNGKVFFESKLRGIEFLYITSVKPVKLNNEIYLLRATKPLLENEVLGLPSVKNMFYVELMIILIITLALSLVLYFRFVRPIENLQRNIVNYQGCNKAERTRRADEIGKLQNSFVALTENLEEERQKQNRIIASISHDIKTPLTSVMGYAERLKKGKFTAERVERYVDNIYLKSLVIKDLIEEFDDYLSCNLRRSFKKQEITVNEIMKAILMDYDDELSHIGVKLEVENHCPGLSLQVDISKLRRVFGNIIGNSLKHFSGEAKRIFVGCRQEKNTVIFSVADNGTGVEKNLMSQIFEPLYTSDAGRSVAGLGLAICKEIINTHGGDIWAESNQFGGLTVRFSLPICFH